MIFILLFTVLAWQNGEATVLEDIQYITPDVDLGSFNSKDIAIPELMRQITRQTKVNLVADQNIREKLTLQLHETSLNQLLNLLVRLYPVECEVVGGTIYLKQRPPEKPEPPKNLINFEEADGSISFDLEGISLMDLTREVTRLTGQNLVTRNQNLGNTIFKGFQASLELKRGLEVLMDTHNLSLNEEDGVFYIGIKAPPEIIPGLQAGPDPTNGANRATMTATGITLTDSGITINYSKAPMQQVFSDLALFGKVPLVIKSELDGAVSINLENIELEALLRLLLTDSPYSYVYRDGAYIIGSKDSDSLGGSRLVQLAHLNAEMVEQMLPDSVKNEVTVTIIKELNSLLLTGSRTELHRLAEVIQDLDQPVPQVLIEVIVVDYNFNDDRKLGLELTNGENKIFPEMDLSFDGFRDSDGSFQVRRLPSNFALTIKALETRGVAKILSKPHVAALNGHQASIKIGTKQFYRIQSEELVGNENPRVRTSEEIREIEANIYLQITPWVTGEGEVTTLIEPTFTSFLGQVDDNIPPPISSRELKSTVRLKDGETIILGGLIQNFDTLDNQGVPFLSKIPLLGALFRTESRNNQQSELVIYITPHVYYGGEGSVEFIHEREGLEYQLDVERQKLGVKAQSPRKESWLKRLRNKRQAQKPKQTEQN